MLEELGLLENVKILSTVSGGTITGAAYAVAVAEGTSFEDFSNRLYNFLRSTNVITVALENLPASVEINRSFAMPSLIRAAAGVYACSDLYGDKTFDFLLSRDGHLNELSFNATDFRTGNSFRFQKSSSEDVRTGNNYAEVKPNVNRLIRLADIVAASSCFPSGFEPIRFPSDFVWSHGFNLESIRRELGRHFAEDIPLMDGGVFDNQGIDSVKNIYKRKKRKGENIDLYIISDTDQRGDALLEFPPVEQKGWLTLSQLRVFVWMIQVASIVTIASIIADAISNYRSGELTAFRAVFLYLIPLAFSVSVVFLIGWARVFALEMQEKIEATTGIEPWRYFKNLTVPEVIEFASSRLKSLIAMASDVFMKRIRDLGYTGIFADTEMNRKIIPNQIYDLDKKLNFKSQWSEFISEAELKPSEKLRAASRRAERYATNLWFLQPEELDNLIFCGRATLCYKIMRYLLRFRAAKLAAIGSPERGLFERARQNWRNLNDGGNEQ